MLNPEWRLKKLWSMAKNRAKEKKLPFDITLEHLLSLWVKGKGCCAVTGSRFDLRDWGDKGQVSPNAPSVDRIIPKNGYVIGNIRLITYHLNIALSDFGLEELKRLSTSILR